MGNSVITKRENRIAIVSGASRGIGAAIALALARRGFVPILAVRRPSAAEAVASQVRDLGVPCHVHSCDVTNEIQVGRLAKEVLETHRRIDVLVNNAGCIQPIGRIAETEPSAWSLSLATNLLGPYLLLQATLPALVSSKGVVINISSGAAIHPREGWSAYCSAKAGLAMLSRCVAHEYTAQGIASYSLQPGVVDTDMQGLIRASGMNEISSIPRERLASPEHAAQVVAWLADRRPDDLHGQELSMDMANLLQRAGTAEGT